jgi:serine/threonine protein kinase
MTALATPRPVSSHRAGRFELRRVLGRGAQATVWLGWDPRLEREVAVKVIDPKADSESVARWLDEARAVSRLAHPNIVPVFEADQDGPVSFMVFELVEGPTLSEHLKARGRLPEREAVQLMRDVLDALATAHAQGIVHRDLKPSNILIDAQGRPRVMDFGIAAKVSGRHDGRIVGSPGYIAPEAVRGEAPAPSMDIFAAGMLLAQLVCGRPLLVEADPYRALERVVRENMAWPEDRSDVDAALRTLAMQAVSRDVASRPESARAFRDALTRWLDPAPVSTDAQDSATFEFLLRRMRHKSDFPALSDAVVRIQRVTQSEGASLQGVTEEIVRDVALTHKLLRLVNTAHFRNAGGGTIASVPRAVQLVGLAGIRTLALSLVLLEHMQDRQHATRLKELFAFALMTGTLVDILTPSAKVADEPFLAGMLSQLGRLITEFYFPDEAALIRRRVDALWQEGEFTPSAEAAVVTDVLGLNYEAIGVGVARVWSLPGSLQRAIRRDPSEPPARTLDANSPDRLRWCVMAAGEMAGALMHTPAQAAPAQLVRIGERYARVLGCTPTTFSDALKTAQSHLKEMSKDLGLDLRSEARARRLLPAEGAGNGTGPSTGTGAGADAGAQAGRAGARSPGAAGAAARGGPAPLPASPGGEPAQATAGSRPALGADGGLGGDLAGSAPVGATDDAARALALEQGIARVTDSLAGDTFRLNEVLRTILETMHQAIGFRRIVFALRDPKSGVLTGRFGLGEANAALCGQMRIDVSPQATPDLLSAACRKGADTLIDDARATNVVTRLPSWLQRDTEARSFLLLPMTMKGSPFALIYGDRAEVGGIVMGERELSLMRTLRNQAVMAFKTAL